MYVTQTETEIIYENGEVVEEIIVSTPKGIVEDKSSAYFGMIFIFIIYNIPTVILLAIYGACREKIKKIQEIDKMNIIDL